MKINMRLIKNLAAASAASFAVLLGALIAAETTGSILLPTPVVAVLSVAVFGSLFWLWVYWLFYFHRTGQRREFWLCYCLPYFYAAYKTVALLRAPPADAA